MLSPTADRCVKAIYLIASAHEGRGPVCSGELARTLGTSVGLVSRTLVALARDGLVIHARYRGVRLTPEGERVALRALRRQRLLECFLARALGLPWEVVREESERLEHALSDRLVEQIDARLGRPAVDPHGDPIPGPDGSIAEARGGPLCCLAAGRRFRVARVDDREPSLLRYLADQGVGLGTAGEVLENRPEAGAVVLRVGGRSVALGREAAEVTLVAPDDR